MLEVEAIRPDKNMGKLLKYLNTYVLVGERFQGCLVSLGASPA